MSSYTELRKEIDDNVFLLPVSKTKSYDAIMSVYDEGARVFGENRVQEVERKFPPIEERPEGMKVFLNKRETGGNEGVPDRTASEEQGQKGSKAV